MNTQEPTKEFDFYDDLKRKREALLSVKNDAFFKKGDLNRTDIKFSANVVKKVAITSLITLEQVVDAYLSYIDFLETNLIVTNECQQ